MSPQKEQRMNRSIREVATMLIIVLMAIGWFFAILHFMPELSQSIVHHRAGY